MPYCWTRNIKRWAKISWVIHIQLGQQEERKFLKGPFGTLSQSKIIVLGHGFSYQIPFPWTTSDDEQNEFLPVKKTDVDRRNAFWLQKKRMPVFFHNEWHCTWSLIWTGYGGVLKTLSVRFRYIMTWINAKLKKNGLDRLEVACNPSLSILRAKQRK